MTVLPHVSRLLAGAAAWARCTAAERSAVALRTARATAAAADAWVEVAVATKRAGDPVSRAEETATGPLVTLRLLLLTARALADIDRRGLPQVARPPRVAHLAGGEASRIEIELIPAASPGRSLYDGAIWGGCRGTVRCANPGGVEAFLNAWRVEAERRPRTGGVALVLGAGNVTGLAPGDAICQIFEYGRAVLLKLHPLHAPFVPLLTTALGPLIDAGVLAIVAGGAEVARESLAAPGIEHVHLTGGAAAFDAVVWGGQDRDGRPVLEQSITCELGNVSPWIVVPGRYTPRQLAFQADLVAASIVNNTSFNCMSTKLVVTARSWPQRDAFLSLVQRRLAGQPPRPAWYPGATAAWEAITEQPAPPDGTLPWMFRTRVDPDRDSRFIDREWFVPVAAELPLAGDSVESFCGAVHDLVSRLPGSLAASVTRPRTLAPHDTARVEWLLEHLPFGVVAANTWSALAYSIGNAPWGGLPGGTLAAPKSGIGFVHDPLLLPMVHNTILRAPLESRLAPPWCAWHPHGASLARGVVTMYAAIARGHRSLGPLLRMLPAVIGGGSPPGCTLHSTKKYRSSDPLSQHEGMPGS